VKILADAVVGQAVLGEIVRADFVAAIAGFHLQGPQRPLFLFFFRLLRLARSEMRACSHFVRVTTHQRFNTARQAARCRERSEFLQYMGVCPEEPLFLSRKPMRDTA
jgi:hypothetical protein